METLLNRYRNISVLLLAIFGQLLLLAYQVRSAEDVPMIRVWAVSAVTPLAKVLEVLRTGTVGFVQGYITLKDTREDNLRIRHELDKLKMENQFLKTQVETADRVKALVAFQAQTPSKTMAARIIGMGAGFNSKVVFVDRGSTAGVEKGMAVVTPDGIVGKVLASYPTASQVMLITDPNFAAGVLSQKNHARGTVKGQGYADCRVEYVQNEQKVDVGEWFYTSGDDRIFPKGFPVGVARVVRPGSSMKDIYIEPSGLLHGLEEVLILTEGVHQAIPDAPPPANEPIHMTSAPPAAPAAAGGLQDDLSKTGVQTDADRLRERYKQIGAAQNHVFGEGTPGSKPPDFNLKLPGAAGQPVQPAAASPKPAAATPPANGAPAPAVPATTTLRPDGSQAPRKTTPAPVPPAAAPPKPAAATPANGAPAPATTTPRPDGSPAPRKTAPTPAPPAAPQEQSKPSKPVDPFL